MKSPTPSFEWGVELIGKEISGYEFTDRVLQGEVDAAFYSVTDLSVISPAVEGLGYEPEPAPGPPDLVNPIGWWGSEMQLNASHLDPIAPANLSFFNRLVAKAFDAEVPSGSSYSNWAKFTVPLDARSSIPACIQAHQRVSPGPSVMVMRPDLSSSPGPILTAVRGVVWAKQTGNLWIAADNQVAEVDLFRVDPQKYTEVEDKAKPYISRVSDDGIFVVVDGNESGVSTIYQINVTSGEEREFAKTKDDDFTRNIQPVGIALSWDGLVSYVADRMSGKVVRIPAEAGLGSSTITDAWGGKDDFGFTDEVAALDVGKGGQVFVVDPTDGDVWQLTGDESGFNTDKNVGSATHVLAIDRDLSELGQARYRFTSAKAAAEAFNLEEIGTDDPAYHGSVVYSDGSNLDLYPEDRPGQIYTIEPRDPQRVIINTSGQNVPYTSPWQVADRVISFTVDGWEGMEFRLELIDPPDTAAYAPDGGWDNGQAKKLPYEANDNSEDLQIADVGLALDPDATTWATSLNVTPGSGGTATVYLKVTDRYAGDNYQVQVKKCAPGGCDAAPPAGVLHDRVVALSPIFTAWKRIFIERDKMFRKGGVLAQDYIPEEDCGTPANPICDCVADPNADCCKGIGPLFCNQIVAYEWQNVVAGDELAVFDEVSTFEKASEVRTVIGVSPDLAHGLARVTLSDGLKQTHEASIRDEPDPPEKYQPTFSNQKSAGYGVISGCDLSLNQINAVDSCFWEGDLRAVEKAFSDGFIEVFSLHAGMSAMPFLGSDWFETPPEDGLIFFNGTWFEGWDPDLNFFHLIGANRDAFITYYGIANAHYNFFYVFRNSIWLKGLAEGKSAQEIDNFTREVTIHELGHQFYVNACTSGGHDSRNAWCEAEGSCGVGGTTPQLCVMTAYLEQAMWDNVFRFCAEDLFIGDPICPDPDPGEPRPGAIRSASDPP